MVTVLAGVIAVLGTSVAFLSSESLNSFIGNVGETFGNMPSQDSVPSTPESTQEQAAAHSEEQNIVEQAAAPPDEVRMQCDVLNVSGEYPILHTGEECFKVFNAHTWVNKIGGRINERSTTAFVVENTGTKTVTIDSIAVSDTAVPIKDWFFTTDPAVVRPANLERELPVDYVENAIVIGGGLVIMESDTITLEPGQSAIVYLNEAGMITEKDVGLTIMLQVQSGNIQLEKALHVVRT